MSECVTNELVLMLGVIIIALVWITYKQMNKQVVYPTYEKEKPEIIVKQDYMVRDVIKDYDMKKYYDPLENPTRRTDRENIPPYYLKRMLDLPTRGYPDNFRLIGTLTHISGTEEESSVVDRNNQVIKLFGRKKYPKGNKYEYYTMLNMGNDSVKIPINNNYNKELNDTDTITLPEMGNAQFTVKLYDDDTFRYYPDIL